MKLTLTLNVDESLIKNRRDASSVIKMVASTIEQGASSGFIRNQKTGDESSTWDLEISKSK
jgi:hypothetical protein